LGVVRKTEGRKEKKKAQGASPKAQEKENVKGKKQKKWFLCNTSSLPGKLKEGTARGDFLLGEKKRSGKKEKRHDVNHPPGGVVSGKRGTKKKTGWSSRSKTILFEVRSSQKGPPNDENCARGGQEKPESSAITKKKTHFGDRGKEKKAEKGGCVSVGEETRRAL